MSENWVIRKGGMFYRAKFSGYTEELCAAGRYTEEVAKQHTNDDPAGRVTAHRVSDFQRHAGETLAQLIKRRRGELGITSKDLESFRYSTRTYIKLVEEGAIVVNRMQINHLSDIANAVKTPLHEVCDAALRSGQ